MEMIARKKVIVSMCQLVQLLPRKFYIEVCYSDVIVNKSYKGCTLIFQFSCSNGHKYMWASSPENVSCGGSAIYATNIVFATALLFSGNAFSKIKKMMDFMGLECISQATYYR